MSKAGKYFAGLLLLLLLGIGCCGCSGSGEREVKLKSNELFAVNDQICARQELLIFLLTQKTKYEASYGEDIWTAQLEDGSFEDYVREALLHYMETLFLVYDAAVQAGIELSSIELEAVKTSAAGYLAAFDAETSQKLGIDREVVERAYSRYMTADIYYRQITQRASMEISEEEARAMLVQIIEIPAALGMETAGAIAGALSSGVGEAGVIAPYESVTMRRETIVRGSYGDDFDTLVFALPKDGVSPVLNMGEAYYIVKCISPYVEEATLTNKLRMEEEIREGAFDALIGEYAADLMISFNTPFWDSIRMSDYREIKAPDFYEYLPQQ